MSELPFIAELGRQPEYSQALKIMLMLTLLSVIPALMIAATTFTRTIIVLSMLRHAFGMQETPPNAVLISLSIFLTLFAMTPVTAKINEVAVQPYLQGRLTGDKALLAGVAPLKDFMVRQTRESDLMLMVDLSKTPRPSTVEEISLVPLIPAFMLSEIRAGFQIGFVVFLPFLLIDLVVASGLMSLGMMMMPPTTVSLPLKILMFVLIDGWNLVIRALFGTFS